MTNLYAVYLGIMVINCIQLCIRLCSKDTLFHVRNIIYIYIPANVLLVNIEGHTYIEKDSQILICQINFIN